MDDLVQWLRAQLDEDERIARAAAQDTGPDWYYNDGFVFSRRGALPQELVERSEFIAAFPLQDFLEQGRGEHVAHHDPARALREIDAKRQLVKLHGRATLRAGGGAQYYDTATVCRSCEPDHQFPELSWPCPTLRLLALPYADRPGYREEWRP